MKEQQPPPDWAKDRANKSDPSIRDCLELTSRWHEKIGAKRELAEEIGEEGTRRDNTSHCCHHIGAKI